MPGTFLSAGVNQLNPKSIHVGLTFQWEEADHKETNCNISGDKSARGSTRSHKE